MREPTLPWELERSAPRDVRLTTGGRALVLLAWLLAAGALAAGVSLHVGAQRQADAALDMDRRAVAASASVDRVWRKSGDGKPAYAAFHFDANGARIDGESRMEVAVWRALHVGSTLRVRYLPDEPRRWVVDGARKGRLPFWVAYAASTTLAALALLCGTVVRSQRTLLSEGRAAHATVTAVNKQHGSHGASHIVMSYEFPLFGGGTTTGKATVSKPAPIGSAITIVYDADEPKRNHPYPFSLVAVDRES